MKWLMLGAAIAAASTLTTTPPVLAGSDLLDTVRARANARAGGPTNPHDAWILERYGALSGTFSSSYYGQSKYGAKRKAYRSKKRQRRY